MNFARYASCLNGNIFESYTNSLEERRLLVLAHIEV